MPAYNFQAQWSDAVQAGVLLAHGATLEQLLDKFGSNVRSKRTTIRANNKKRVHPGDMLTFYTGQRTPQCTGLGMALCLAVTPIEVNITYARLGETILTSNEWHNLALLDRATLGRR